jgi:hypothetical protein
MVEFKGGRLPNDPSKPRLTLDLSSAPPAPASVDWLHQVDSFPMYGNDSIGDCTVAAAGHMVQAWTAAASTEVTVPEAAVLAMYEAVSGYDPATGANDNGAVMQDVLNLWRKEGLGGHKILGFAQVKHADAGQVMAAIAAFGGIYIGVNFPGSAMDQFNAGEPWTVVAGAAIEGGHAVNAGAYDPKTYKCVTWAQVQVMDDAWWAAYVEEAWVIITADWITVNGSTPAGLAVAALGTEFTALTGQPSPFVPSPTPAPPVTPPPVPPTLPVAVFLAAVPAGWENEHHIGNNEKVAHAVQALRKAIGG